MTMKNERTCKDVEKKCYKLCRENEINCEDKECRYWINYKDDNNCTFNAIYKNGEMTLKDIGERLGISIVEVGKIEKRFIKRMQKYFFKDGEFKKLKDYLY